MTAPDSPDPLSLSPGLYIVATPIGNLQDLTARAADLLCRADLIACEDKRVTAKILSRIGSRRPMIAFHDHSTPGDREALLARMAGQSVALVSDAGTPLISDPGHDLVREARARGIPVTTAPGPCAAIAALSIAGLPANRFFFEGFLPARATARDAAIEALVAVPGTLVFHETGPRLGGTLAALNRILGDREAAVARELTKLHEEVVRGRLSELAAAYRDQVPKGEIVLLVGPRPDHLPPADGDEAVDAALRRALQTLSPGKAAASVAAAFGLPRAEVYRRVLSLHGDEA
jgi:16S rRNA (cytidine1402-2'-O)-methyltransferase